MPSRPARACRWPGCANLVYGSGPPYCAEHLAMKRRERDADRPSAAERGYGAKWRKLRAKYLKQHPRCVQCGAKATVVDHIVPRAAGGSDDWVNLQALCKRCHDAKTMKQSVRVRE